MARIGFFGNRTKDPDAPATVATAAEADRDPMEARSRIEAQEDRTADRNGDGIVSDTEARAARERTEARVAARQKLATQERADEASADRTTILRDRPVVTDRPVEERRVVDRTDADRAEADRIAAERAATLAAERTAAREAEEARQAPKIRARTSMLGTLALIVGLTTVYAALSGRLAPAAMFLGVIGLVLSFGGLTATGRPRVTGSTMAFLALLLSVGGGVLAVLAMNHTTSWLDSDVDQVARLRDWLDTQLPFIRTW